MSISQTTLDYSDRDFNSLRLRLQDVVRSVFPDWTDFNVANFGNILIELMAHVGDILHFYQDTQAAQAFWPTLTERIAAIRLGQLIDFRLTGASSSTGDVTVSIPVANTSYDLDIPVGTVFRTSDPEEPLRFRSTQAKTLLAGQTEVDVPVEQAESVPDEDFDSTDDPNQEIVLSRSPFLDGSATVSATDGDYTEVTSFLGYTSTDRVFIVQVDEFDRAHIKFGNGVTGSIPSGVIDVSYKVGGGANGNVERGKISILEDTLFFTSGDPAPTSVTNEQATSGGADRMGLSEARVKAPASLKVLTRTVTREDFETVAESVAGVARAVMVTSNEYAGIQENTGRIYVVAQGSKLDSGRIAPATPSSTILANIASEIDTNKPSTITFSYETLAAPFKSIPVSARIYLAKGATAATVAANIRAALADFFAAQLEDGTANPNIDFGANLLDAAGTIVGEIVWSDVFNVVRDIDGVRKVDEGSLGFLLDGKRESVTLLPIEFPQLSTITLTNADTGVAL